MNIELVQIFVKVVQTGGFSRAAAVLKLPKSTVSKAVSRLENESGTKLLLRTTRSQTLTAAGRAFYDSCLGPVQAIEDAQKSLSGSDSLLSGTLKVTAPEDLGTELLSPAVGRLIGQHPGLNFELVYSDERMDLVRDGYDLAIRIGPLGASGLRSKKIGDVKLVLVASSEYLAARPRIQRPEDLSSHACLTFNGGVGKHFWQLQSKAATAKVPITARVTSNQMTALLKAAIGGAGVAVVPAFLACSAAQAGKIVRVLPQWATPGVAVSLLSPLPFSSSARLRMVSDYFAAELQKGLAKDP